MKGRSQVFSRKNRVVFPDQEPPLFFGHNAPPGLPEVPDRPVELPVFHAQRNAAKLHGFFPFKTPGFKKYLIKTIIVERIGTISTGTSGTQIRPEDSPSEKRSWETVGPAHTPFIKGTPGLRGYLPGVGVRVIIRPPPSDLTDNGRIRPGASATPARAGCGARSLLGTMAGTAGARTSRRSSGIRFS